MPDSTPLDPEISELQAALAKDPRYMRLTQLLEMRQAYLGLPSIEAQTRIQQRTMFAADDEIADAPSRGGRRRTPEREQALREAKTLLAGRTEPTRITDIDAHLVAKGIRLGGSDPLNNLSALLSTSGEFIAHGRAGWTLDQQTH